MTFEEFEERVKKMFPRASIDADYDGSLIINTRMKMSDAVDIVDDYDGEAFDDESIDSSNEEDSVSTQGVCDEEGCILFSKCETWIEDGCSGGFAPCETCHQGNVSCDGKPMAENDICNVCNFGRALPPLENETHDESCEGCKQKTCKCVPPETCDDCFHVSSCDIWMTDLDCRVLHSGRVSCDGKPMTEHDICSVCGYRRDVEPER